ncbi:TlpA family protein disulfide reductase [Candidatus Fermentibacteria bacterium]|nr:TlpA family protein disulfide reductase [Candidatus Fermentibacteria bacterium]
MYVHFLPDTLESGQTTPDLTFTTDSETAWMLDVSSRYLVSGLISEGGEDILQPTATAAMMEFVIGGPFQAEMAADTLRYEGVDTVGGVECDVVYVVYADGAGRARWHFGAADALPRRVERYDPTGSVSGAQVLELSNLRQGVGVEPADLILVAPDDSFTVETYRAVLEAGTPAPDWSLTSTAGEVVTLSELRDTVVVLDFWATWCGPCASAIPSIQALHEEMAGRPVKVLGLNVWENGDPVSFMEEMGVTYPVLTDADSVADLYLVTAIPTFYVIGGDGRIVLARRGFEPGMEDGMRSAVLEALDGLGPR